MRRSSCFPFLVLLLTVAIVPAAAEDETSTAPSVASAVVCTEIDREQRTAIGEAERFPASSERLYCLSDVRDAEGGQVWHAWIHEGVTRARVALPVRGKRWRTWSSKRLLPSWTGDWEVKVLTDDGIVLSTVRFTVE